MSIYTCSGKRTLDIIIALTMLVLLLPLFVIFAVMIRLTLGTPVIFRQHRPGFEAKPIVLYKFRTMIKANDLENIKLPDAERLTFFGRFMRRLSLDELPELWNVLKGEMSFVGPRPLLMEYLGRYTPEQSRRHEVKPGITGWAQVNGRNAITWEEKFEYDVWYVDNWNLGLDLKILWMTLLMVIKREGINYPGQATMPTFRGSDQSVSS